jgi:hypothetical protein
MDIRLVRGKQHRVWVWVGVLVALLMLAWASALVFGDATLRGGRAGGAAAGFGEGRGAVVPMQTEPFENVQPLQDRELGRMVRLSGTAESRARKNAVWVRTARGRRILVRFEPDPPEGALAGVYPGAAVSVAGYLGKISRAELDVWLDTLGVVLPRPRPGVKFGDLPDSNFARVDSLFIKDYYISVRPEGIGARASAPPPPAAAPSTGLRPAGTTPAPPPAAEPEPAEDEVADEEIPVEPVPAEPVPAEPDTTGGGAP